MEKKSINSLPLEALEEAMRQAGQPAFRAKQVFSWLHGEGVRSFDEMTNVPKALRQALAQEWFIDAPKVARRLCSQKDGTVKLLLQLDDGNYVETVLMKYSHGYSVCISSQVGCRMGCRFCASTQNGLVRGLTAGEMAAQVAEAARNAEGGKVSNLVLMGIGEPLDNFDNVVDFISIITHPAGQNLSGRGISLSTCGLVPGIQRLAEKKLSLTLSVSLHAANDALRSELMPVNNKWPLAQMTAACRAYRKATGRRVSFEYTLLAGVNDGPGDAQDLIALVKGTDSHINLIPANRVDGSPYGPSSPQVVEQFKAALLEAGVQATVRRRLGTDIDAACGQLRMRQQGKEEST